MYVKSRQYRHWCTKIGSESKNVINSHVKYRHLNNLLEYSNQGFGTGQLPHLCHEWQDEGGSAWPLSSHFISRPALFDFPWFTAPPADVPPFVICLGGGGGGGGSSGGSHRGRMCRDTYSLHKALAAGCIYSKCSSDVCRGKTRRAH